MELLAETIAAERLSVKLSEPCNLQARANAAAPMRVIRGTEFGEVGSEVSN